MVQRVALCFQLASRRDSLAYLRFVVSSDANPPAPPQGATLAERLEGLTAAAQESLEREDGLRKAIEELTATEVSTVSLLETHR